MSTRNPPLRVVQWTTGNIARQAIKAVVERPDLELVGVFAYSADKVGKDASELAGLTEPTGVTATDDINALIGLQPDCVLYMPLHPNVDHLVQLLENGVNVLNTASFITGRAYGEESRRRLQTAAESGGASLFGGGINPGFADYITALVSGPCRDVNYLKVFEPYDISGSAGDANQDELGWGREAGSPNHADDIMKATAPFGDAVEAMAELFGVDVD